jgi:hypothetical protein
VRADYQGQLLPQGLVWEGLAQYLRARPHYRSLLRSVHLSHHLPAVPKTTVAAFVAAQCLAPEATPLRLRRAVRYRALPWLLAPRHRPTTSSFCTSC